LFFGKIIGSSSNKASRSSSELLGSDFEFNLALENGGGASVKDDFDLDKELEDAEFNGIKPELRLLI
jgi:hypothetical protein